jgi:tetratricopeptide (TPR) repeat protein
MGVSPGRIPIILSLTLALAILAPAVGPAPGANDAGWISRIDALRVRSRADSALILIAQALPEAEAAADSTLLLALWLRQGELMTSLGRAREGEPVLRRTWNLAMARSDSATGCAALRWLSVAVGTQGRTEEALDLYRELLAVAQRLGDRRHEAWARVGLAWDAEIHGRYQEAIDHYSRACAMFRETGEKRGEAWARNGLGNALAGVGRYDDARRSYTESEDLASRIGHDMAQCLAANNLGKLEYALGDPGAAMDHFREVIRLHQRIGNIRESIIPGINMALCDAELGDVKRAADSLESMLARCDREGYADLSAMVLNHLAHTRSLQGRAREARSLYRRSISLETSAHLKNRVEAVVGLAGLLSDADSSGAALALLEQTLASLPSGSDPECRVQLRVRTGETFLRCGRASDALPPLRDTESEALRLGLTAHREEALILLGRAHIALGRPDRARVAWEEAARVWEILRGTPRDPEWREARGGSGRSLSTDLTALLLGDHPTSERIGQAYQRAQGFKARTLLERMSGPAWDEKGLRHVPTLGQLQGSLLADGDLLLDFFLGPSRSYLFAITRDSCRVSVLPPEGEIESAARLYYDILQAPRSGGGLDAGVREAGTRLHARLFAGVEDLLRTHRRILVSPDGALNLLPFGALEEPKSAEAAWIRIPSVAILNQIRSRGTDRPAAPMGVLILADQSSPSGRLRGVAEEVTDLMRRYRGIDARYPSDRDTLRLSDLAQVPAILHVACHTRTDDQRPWLSELRLGAGGLRANQIAGASIPARLAVLSSCQTQHARVLSGEGVLGLSAALLCAGTECVVATLWPVEDRSTARFMRFFYNGLASGQSVARAVRSAQDVLRSDPATAHPFYWAGFVAIGRGEITVPLARRSPDWIWWAVGGLLSVAAILTLSRRSRRERSR